MTPAAFPRAADSCFRPPAAPWRSGADLLKIHGDYGSIVDHSGWAQFSVFWATLLADGDPRADEWADNWRARGYTHIALSPVYGYPGSPIAGGAFTTPGFIELVRYTLDAGFSPVLFLSDVPEQAAMVISIILALKDAGLLPYVVCVPAWEPVKTDYYRSKQLSDLLIAMKDAGGDEIVIGVHLQPGRWSMSSYVGTAPKGTPVPEGAAILNYFTDEDTGEEMQYLIEDDDPWRGDEQECWKSHGGEHVRAFLNQFEHGFTQTTAPDWKNRFGDGVPRMCQGLNGWRIMDSVSVYETVLYDSYRNQCDEARAREIAAEAEAFARDMFQVTGLTYGNGAPPDEAPPLDD